MNASEQPALLVGGQSKIRADHLKRLACVYIRQSSMKQVARNRESQVNQYRLIQRAEALGWNRERIRVLDADLGLSAQSSEHRSGFKELVAEVSLGHVGIIFGYEVSRLARNNSDWYHLLDLAAVFGTLIADNDGVYDPRLYNDRLLLGLKGTMSEAELHLLRQRLEAGRMSQVYRGEYRQHLPTGLVRLADGRVVKDSDDQVRHVIELLFLKFEELGSCRRVMRYLRQESILLPRHQPTGLHKGLLLWKLPSDAAIYDILRNPAYAGAFAYGRSQADPTHRQPGRPASGRLRLPQGEWLHLQLDVYPAYISWEQYLANQERLHQNAMRFGQNSQRAHGATRHGSALLQGLAVCGCCGHHMHVAYKSAHRYFCDALAKRFDAPTCVSLHGPTIDEAVVQAFFEAIQPAQLDALEAVLAAQHMERERLVRQWEDRLKRARYEAHLAQRQYDAVDPDNRLVAAELERRWEQQLRELQAVQEAYDSFQQTPEPAALITPELREQLRHISETLPQLWQAGQVSNAQKKELLRCLIAQVNLKRETPDTIEVKIVWVSGHYSVVYARPPILQQQDLTRYNEMVERIRVFWEQGLDDDQIAAQLTTEGFRSARSTNVLPMTVQKIRLEKDWHLTFHQSRNALELQGYLTPRGLAARIGVERTWVYRRIYSGQINSGYVIRHPQSRNYLIQDDPELIQQLRLLLPEKHRSQGGI